MGCFNFTYLSFHVSTNDWNVVFGNTMDEGKQLIVDGDEVSSITGIGGIAADDCCAEVAVKCG